MFGNLKFIKEEHQQKYLQKGHLTMPLLDNSQIAMLAQIFHRHFDISNVPIVYDTVADIPVEKVKIVHEEINEVCQSIFEKVVQDFRIVASIFITKKSGEDSYLGVHLDASMTLEGYNNIGIWIPLSHIDEQTGKICVLGNSHRFLPPYVNSSMPAAYHDIESVAEKHLTCLAMKPGEALFFNNSMLHCTQKNISGNYRIAVVIKLIDANAPMVTAYYDANSPKGKMVSLYQHEEKFFLPAAIKSSTPPTGSRFIGYVPELPKVFTEEEFVDLIQQYS